MSRDRHVRIELSAELLLEMLEAKLADDFHVHHIAIDPYAAMWIIHIKSDRLPEEFIRYEGGQPKQVSRDELVELMKTEKER